MVLSTSREIALVVMALFLFVATNFAPPTLGIIYVLFVFGYMYVIENILPEFPLWRGRLNVGKSLAMIVGGIALWLLISSYAMNYFGAVTTISRPQSIITILASNTQIPYVSDNPYIYLFVFGFLIPIAESMFFLGVLLPYIEKKFMLKGKIERIIITSIVIGSIVSLWHLTSHIFSDQALMADFIFFAISSVVVLNDRELRTGILLHIFANTLIILSTLGWLI